MGGRIRRTIIRSWIKLFTPRWSLFQLYRFSDRMACLLRAALPLSDCLLLALPVLDRKLLRHSPPPIDFLQDGSPLSSTLSVYHLPPASILLIRLGEENGDFVKSFAKLADYYERRSMIRQQWRKAIAYPLVLTFVSTVAGVYLLYGVLPAFASLYSGMRITLPSPTSDLLLFSVILRRLLPMIACILTACGLLWIVFRLRKSGWSDWVMTAFSRIRLVRNMAEVEFAETLALLLDGGMPLIHCLDVMESLLLRKGAVSMAVHVKELVLNGSTISAAVTLQHVSSVLQGMVRIGERTGELAEAFDKAATLIRKDVENVVDSFLRWLEPGLITIFGIWVGFLTYAMLLPTLDLIHTW